MDRPFIPSRENLSFPVDLFNRIYTAYTIISDGKKNTMTVVSRVKEKIENVKYDLCCELSPIHIIVRHE